MSHQQHDPAECSVCAHQHAAAMEQHRNAAQTSSGATGMSETTTWTVDIDNADSGGGSWSVITAPKQPEIQVRGDGHSLLAERIARLLTEEDAANERAAMDARLLAEADKDEGPVANMGWVRWERGLRDELGLPELRALEAAYRAATEQEGAKL